MPRSCARCADPATALTRSNAGRDAELLDRAAALRTGRAAAGRVVLRIVRGPMQCARIRSERLACAVLPTPPRAARREIARVLGAIRGGTYLVARSLQLLPLLVARAHAVCEPTRPAGCALVAQVCDRSRRLGDACDHWAKHPAIPSQAIRRVSPRPTRPTASRPLTPAKSTFTTRATTCRETT